MHGNSARWFVGCACDRAFVQHTSVMLTSLAVNGGVPEATIIVAAFDLAPEDYEAIRAHAGTMRNHVRFVDVTASKCLRTSRAVIGKRTTRSRCSVACSLPARSTRRKRGCSRLTAT